MRPDKERGVVDLFVTDIDGCLAVPFKPFRLDRIAKLRALTQSANSDAVGASGPAVSICSGRSYAYVEAMAQLLGLDQPVLFESSGGMIFPGTMEFELNPAFTPDVEARVNLVRSWCEELIADSDMWIDHGKRTQAGLVGSVESIASILPKVQAHVLASFPDLHCMHTTVSIDVVPDLLGKEHGMQWLARHCGSAVDRMAYIGDSNGDIEALRCVGHSFAPANAAEDVKDAVHRVTMGSDIDGVIEAFQEVVALNQEAHKSNSAGLMQGRD